MDEKNNNNNKEKTEREREKESKIDLVVSIKQKKNSSRFWKANEKFVIIQCVVHWMNEWASDQIFECARLWARSHIIAKGK